MTTVQFGKPAGLHLMETSAFETNDIRDARRNANTIAATLEKHVLRERLLDSTDSGKWGTRDKIWNLFPDKKW